MLRIQIDSQDSLALSVYIRADIYGGGGLSNPAFARDKRDDFTHRCYLHFHTAFGVVQTLFGAVFRGTMYLIGGECTVYRLRKPLILLAFCLNPIRIRVPYMKNPNYFTIGSAFGFFVYIKDITY